MPQPQGYKKALRLFYYANRFNMPIITLIDTPGAYPGITAEQTGQGIAIAQNLRDMAKLDVPVIADGDTGYGNALSAQRTMREYELNGAAGILLEDQVWPKRCGHMAGKQVVEAAEHAKKLFPRKKYKIEVIPCKDIATSYLTCLSFNPELDEDDTIKAMTKAYKNCVSCKISRSVKNITYKELNIKYGDYIGVINKEIIANSKNQSSLNIKMIKELFEQIRRPKTCVIIYGKDATIEEVNNMYKFISETYLIKPILVHGNQTTYHYYIGVTK